MDKIEQDFIKPVSLSELQNCPKNAYDLRSRIHSGVRAGKTLQ